MATDSKPLTQACHLISTAMNLVDVDRNGIATKEEFISNNSMLQGSPEFKEALMDVFDDDGNSIISAQEFSKHYSLGEATSLNYLLKWYSALPPTIDLINFFSTEQGGYENFSALLQPQLPRNTARDLSALPTTQNDFLNANPDQVIALTKQAYESGNFIDLAFFIQGTTPDSFLNSKINKLEADWKINQTIRQASTTDTDGYSSKDELKVYQDLVSFLKNERSLGWGTGAGMEFCFDDRCLCDCNTFVILALHLLQQVGVNPKVLTLAGNPGHAVLVIPTTNGDMTLGMEANGPVFRPLNYFDRVDTSYGSDGSGLNENRGFTPRDKESLLEPWQAMSTVLMEKAISCKRVRDMQMEIISKANLHNKMAEVQPAQEKWTVQDKMTRHYYEMALMVGPESVAVHFNLGRYYQEKYDQTKDAQEKTTYFNLARENYLAATKVNSKFIPPFYNLAYLNLKQGDFVTQDKVKYYQEALNLMNHCLKIIKSEGSYNQIKQDRDKINLLVQTSH